MSFGERQLGVRTLCAGKQDRAHPLELKVVVCAVVPDELRLVANAFLLSPDDDDVAAFFHVFGRTPREHHQQVAFRHGRNEREKLRGSHGGTSLSPCRENAFAERRPGCPRTRVIANIGKGVPEDIGSGNGVLLSFARQRMIFSSGEDVIRICELDRMKSGGERHDGGDREVDFSGRQLPAFFYSLPRGSLKTATIA